jgi:hypothetical protein
MAIDEKKKKDLLARFGKSTELAIKLIEDDSSGDGTDGGTQVKILHLVQPVNAVGSIPTPDGTEMKASGAKVYVAQDDIDKMLENVDEKDGILIYKGDMHLDVSKPGGRTVNGQFVITKPAKIWLTSVKFSRRGGQLRTSQTNNLGDMINKMFSGGKTLDLTAETTTATGASDNKDAGDGKTPPTVVANGTKDAVVTT